MKKALVLLLAAAVLLTCGAVAAASRLAAPADQISFTERVQYGDATAAEGLQVHHNMEGLDHLAWRTTVDFTAEGPQANTDFSYEKDTMWNHPWNRDQICYVDFWVELEYYTTDFEVFGFEALKERLQQLVDETPNGEVGETVLYLSDYYTDYPFGIQISTDEIWFSAAANAAQETDLETECANRLLDYFKIPVLESDAVHFYVEKNADGSIESLYYDLAEDGGLYTPAACSTVTDGAIYFSISNRSFTGELVDTSHIPGGYGIYILPYGEKTVTEANGSESKYTMPFAEELRLFYPVDPQAEIIRLEQNDDGTELLLYTLENGTVKATVISLADGSALQELTLGNCAENGYPEIYTGNGFRTVILDSRFVVLAETGGEWRIAISTEPKEIELQPDYLSRITHDCMAFDGSRLAIYGGHCAETGWCGFYTAVYNAEGLAYYAGFESSLDRAADPESVPFHWGDDGSELLIWQ